MNILFSELLSHFVLAIGDGSADVARWRGQVSEFLLELLGTNVRFFDSFASLLLSL